MCALIPNCSCVNVVLNYLLCGSGKIRDCRLLVFTRHRKISFCRSHFCCFFAKNFFRKIHLTKHLGFKFQPKYLFGCRDMPEAIKHIFGGNLSFAYFGAKKKNLCNTSAVAAYCIVVVVLSVSAEVSKILKSTNTAGEFWQRHPLHLSSEC